MTPNLSRIRDEWIKKATNTLEPNSLFELTARKYSEAAWNKAVPYARAQAIFDVLAYINSMPTMSNVRPSLFNELADTFEKRFEVDLTALKNIEVNDGIKVDN